MRRAAADGRARVLAIHRYYWPDTPPYASLLRAIVEAWRDDGHDVEVLSTQPSYKPELELAARPRHDRVDGIPVHRVSLGSDRKSVRRRLFNTAWFPLVVAWRILLGRRHDVVMCSTAPPVVLAWLVSMAAGARGAQFIYHCMDIHPEIGALSGEFRARPVRAVLRRMDLATCRRAAAIVVLSDDMRDAVVARDASLEDAVVVLNNFDVPTHDETAAQPPPPTGRRRLVFAGNIGRFQGLEHLTRAVLADAPGREQLELVFMGEGAAKQKLQAMVDDAPASVRDRVIFLPHGSAASARALVATGDFGVVSLTPRVIRYAYPSKTATYLAEGTPILALVESDSELARFVVEEGCGFAVEPRDSEGLAHVLDKIASDDAHDAAARRAAARATWRMAFAAEVILPRWRSLLSRVIAPESACAQ